MVGRKLFKNHWAYAFGILILGVPYGQKSYKIYTESNRILGEAPVGTSYISAPYGRKLIKIILKINQK